VSTQLVVGVADCVVTADPAAILVTYALGSCIAICVVDVTARVGGMLHLMLPDSGLKAARGETNPYMYADTGIPLLLSRVMQAGAKKSQLSVKVAGGASVMDDNGFFDIGKRNILSMRKLLWKAGILIAAEDLGGNVFRTVRLEVATGKLLVKSGQVSEPASAQGAQAR
jgi:chemotaxis protein CheD